MDEQQREITNATTDDTGPDDSKPMPERQAELRQTYEANIAIGKPPYAGVVIGSRGELKWIISERGWSPESMSARSNRIDLRDSLISCDISGMNLAYANLIGALVAEADWSQVDLSLAAMNDAILDTVNLSNADLSGATLSDALVVNGNFTGANLSGSKLVGTRISGNFSGADLLRARMDAGTIIGGPGEGGEVKFDAETRLGDISWNGALLSSINWDRVRRLGDELDIKDASNRKDRVEAYRNAARAYFGLAKALEAQGLSAPALRYRRRQHQLERAAQLRSFNLLGWLFSNALNIVSGYGDRPLRAFGVYLAVILAFAGVYFGITTSGSPIFFSGSQPLQFHEAVVFSMSSFHGRGFFPSTIGLGDPVAIVAALEAVVGLFIELVLIATFTRRLFER